jgi:curved DNA-binding protein CbpA
MAEPYSDPYAVLGVPRTAAAAAIRSAYFALVRAHPPERDPDNFKRIRAAYEHLRDPERRAETDMQLLQSWTAPARKRRAQTLDLTVHREDILTVARALTDLERTDWREYFVKVRL